jgi:hypothetical protein
MGTRRRPPPRAEMVRRPCRPSLVPAGTTDQHHDIGVGPTRCPDPPMAGQSIVGGRARRVEATAGYAEMGRD